jgi:uncharacterized protein YqeY
VKSGVLQKCLSSTSYLPDPRPGVGSDVEEEEVTILAEFMCAPVSRSDVAGEEGNTISAVEEEEVTILAEFMRAPVSRAQSQPSVSVNDISADLTEEGTGSQNIRQSDPETEAVSCMLV